MMPRTRVKKKFGWIRYGQMAVGLAHSKRLTAKVDRAFWLYFYFVGKGDWRRARKWNNAAVRISTRTLKLMGCPVPVLNQAISKVSDRVHGACAPICKPVNEDGTLDQPKGHNEKSL